MVTDSFITQAEEAVALLDAERPYVSPGTNAKVQDALRSLLGEYKRLTTEQEWEYGVARRASMPDMSGRPSFTLIVNSTFPTLKAARAIKSIVPALGQRPALIVKATARGPWVPVEGEDQ